MQCFKKDWYNLDNERREILQEEDLKADIRVHALMPILAVQQD